MENREPILQIVDVTAGYDHKVVLSDASISVYPDSFIALVGPNGGGKTTMIRLMLKQLAPMRGSVKIADNINIGYLPQINDADLEFPISVLDVVLSGTKCTFRHSKEEISYAHELLRFVQLDELSDRQIGQLSGGQRQRAFLCRALMCKPQLLILDEPSTYMDKDSSSNMYELLSDLHKSMAIVLVSHDIDSMSHRAHTIIRVDRTTHLVSNHYSTVVPYTPIVKRKTTN
ncbi:MAG: ATP-binding cassette domain-containing protein [Bacteroidia bacterium]|nr:ATP-binding cassette domain-containing protein [Bacteroidia bacterium]